MCKSRAGRLQYPEVLPADSCHVPPQELRCLHFCGHQVRGGQATKRRETTNHAASSAADSTPTQSYQKRIRISLPHLTSSAETRLSIGFPPPISASSQRLTHAGQADGGIGIQGVPRGARNIDNTLTLKEELAQNLRTALDPVIGREKTQSSNWESLNASLG